MNYIICEISGRQYLIEPGQIIEVDKLTADKNLLVDKVLLAVSEGKIEIGKPYLSSSVNFEVLGTQKKAKVRTATYKPKANYRRIKGQRREVTKIRLAETVIKTEKKTVKKG